MREGLNEPEYNQHEHKHNSVFAEDPVATRGRTYARQRTIITQPRHTRGLVLPQVGYVRERRHDFLFTDEGGLDWYRIDPERYPDLTSLVNLRRELLGTIGDPVFVIRPLQTAADPRVNFPFPGDEIDDLYRVEFIMSSPGRLTVATLSTLSTDTET